MTFAPLAAALFPCSAGDVGNARTFPVLLHSIQFLFSNISSSGMQDIFSSFIPYMKILVGAILHVGIHDGCTFGILATRCGTTLAAHISCPDVVAAGLRHRLARLAGVVAGVATLATIPSSLILAAVVPRQHTIVAPR